MKFLPGLLFSATLILLSLNLPAQTLYQEKLARAKCDSAVKLADKGDIQSSITLLQEAVQLDPVPVRYPAELAWSYYLNNDLDIAGSILHRVSIRPDADDRLFLFLGSIYEKQDKQREALDIYQEGVKRFPQSAILYSALSASLIRSRSYNQALLNAENGIQADPSFADNYYLASSVYCHSSEKVWGMIYGEIYLNLTQEKDSLKAIRMSGLLYSTFQHAVHLDGGAQSSVGGGQTSVDFSDIASADMSETLSPGLPYQVSVYESLMLAAVKPESVLDLYTLSLVRSRFLAAYNDKGLNKSYPNILFDYQTELENSGNSEAYTNWIFQAGDPDRYAEWVSHNKGAYTAFKTWKMQHPLVVSKLHYFISSQYSSAKKPEAIKIERKISDIL